MNQCLRNLAVAAVLFYLVQPGHALSQATYDPSTDQAPSDQSSSGHRHHHGTDSQHASPSADSGSNLRDADDRKLDSLADEYYHVSAKSEHPVEKLKEIQERVKAYQSTLEQRTYAGSADLIHDTMSLEQRINAKKKKLIEQEAKAKKAAAPVSSTPAPQKPAAAPQH